MDMLDNKSVLTGHNDVKFIDFAYGRASDSLGARLGLPPRPQSRRPLSPLPPKHWSWGIYPSSLVPLMKLAFKVSVFELGIGLRPTRFGVMAFICIVTCIHVCARSYRPYVGLLTPRAMSFLLLNVNRQVLVPTLLSS